MRTVNIIHLNCPNLNLETLANLQFVTSKWQQRIALVVDDISANGTLIVFRFDRRISLMAGGVSYDVMISFLTLI